MFSTMNSDDDRRVLPFCLPPETEETRERRRAEMAAYRAAHAEQAERLIDEFFEWLNDPAEREEVRHERLMQFLNVSIQASLIPITRV